MDDWHPDLSGYSGPKYLAIADAIADAVASGALSAGVQMPTHRSLADRLQVTVGTVTRAYKEARLRGLLRGEVGRGTYIATPPTDATSFQHRNEQLEAAPGVVNLCVNLPLYCIEPDLAQTLQQMSQRGDLAELIRYQPHEGRYEHRVAGAIFASRFGIETGPERVLVCAGAQHALTVCFSTLARPGERILTEALTYPGLKAVARLFNLQISGVAMDEHGLIPEALEAACRAGDARALYVLPTIQNPTCAVLSAERRREIANIAERYDLAIVEDDVHRLLAPEAPPSFVHYAPERTYAICSMSKSVAGGLRTAFLVAPERAVRPLARRIWGSIWTTPPLTTEIASIWIQDGTADRITEGKRQESAARQAIARELLQGIATYYTHPNSFHLWLLVPEPWRASDFANACREAGVAVTPSHEFAVERSGYPHGVRVSLSGPPTRQQVRRGLELLAEVLSLRQLPVRSWL